MTPLTPTPPVVLAAIGTITAHLRTIGASQAVITPKWTAFHPAGDAERERDIAAGDCFVGVDFEAEDTAEWDTLVPQSQLLAAERHAAELSQGMAACEQE